MTTPATPQQLLHGLLEYIREQAKVAKPGGFRVSGTGADGFVCRRADIAGQPGIELDLRSDDDHIWLRVSRLAATSPPPLPAVVLDLITASADPDGAPPAVSQKGIEARIEKLPAEASSAERNAAAKSWCALAEHHLGEYVGLWAAWAQCERPIRRTIALYGELFALKHQLEAEETTRPRELVWGLGLTTWSVPVDGEAVPIEYPLLTQTLEIAIDEQTMAIEIRPRASDARVEMEAFSTCAVEGAAAVERSAKALIKREGRPATHPFEVASYSDILRLAAGKLDSEGQYLEVQADNLHVPAPGPHLVVSDEWLLFSRPRSHNYLFEDLQRLQDALTTLEHLPGGPGALVTPPTASPIHHSSLRFRGLSGGGAGGAGEVQELYFPLPYNDEQVTIVQRLEQSPGVAVQGPPGTGKTHTIANIICHYLATGRRVLVTSRGEQALAVLQSKIPDEVRKLTVSLLNSDREGIRQFQATIETIQQQISQLNPEIASRAIDTQRDAIDRAHAEITHIDRRIDEIAQAQLDDIEVDGMRMRAQQMAQLAVAGEAVHGWFDDRITLAPAHAPPLSEHEAGVLRESRRLVGADLIHLDARLPAPDTLPGEEAIAGLHQVLARMHRIEAQVSRGELPGLTDGRPEVLDAACAMLVEIRKMHPMLTELEALGTPWPFELREKCRQALFRAERDAFESLFPEIDALVEARASFLREPVEVPEAALTCDETHAAVQRAARTGKPFTLFAFGVGDAKAHVAAIRISGLAPTRSEEWQHIARYFALHRRVLSFQVRWNTFAQDLSLPALQGGVPALKALEYITTTARTAHKLATRHDPALADLAQRVFLQPQLLVLTGPSSALQTLSEHLDAHLTRAKLAEATTQVKALREQLADGCGKAVDDLRAFVDRVLGQPTLAPLAVAGQYAGLIAELDRQSGLAPHFAIIRDGARRLAAAGAPRLALRVRSMAVNGAGEDRGFPSTWREAWNWSRIRAHLQQIEARAELVTLFDKRHAHERALARLYKEMVAQSAWLRTKQNATPKVLQALAAYASAIRRIGRGTGPNAVRYRRDAREAMFDAADAVPCWIMSHARISEAMPAEVGGFDLVIVDEASQSDLWALPAILRGKKILVVGDDKQVSPDGGFIASGRIDALKARFLAEQPYANDMTPEKSLYDLAARVFAAHQVMLREHFRCVPAIIAYSNATFYQGNIIPLRIPTAQERLDPPLVDIYVPHGLRDKRSRNLGEAKAIAAEIEALLANPDMQDRTLGVVSLLGPEQARLIDETVRARCDAAELHHRRFECGDARTFQGSERDIMFLSLVVDPEHSQAVSTVGFEQRFNVAASRARDRMYLVRSVKLAELSPKDLRQSLVKHFEAPLLADSADHEALIDLCESGFEREVFTMLSARGYRVIPQVRSGAFRIDMVVESAHEARLAIELDGDEFHGPERWAHDMARQRVLERAGWVFWRCFASTWSLDRDAVFGELIATLERMGIAPIGAANKVPALVERRVWMHPAEAPTRDVDDGPEPVAANPNTASAIDPPAKTSPASPSNLQQSDRPPAPRSNSRPTMIVRTPEAAKASGRSAVILSVCAPDGDTWRASAFSDWAIEQALAHLGLAGTEDAAQVALTRPSEVHDALVELRFSPVMERTHATRNAAEEAISAELTAKGWTCLIAESAETAS